MDTATADLQTAELAYLLATLDAQGVVGVDNDAIFPKGGARDALLQEGLAALKEHGWLRPGSEPGSFDMDDDIALIAATMADPEKIILTERKTEAYGAQLLTHYLTAPQIVEQMKIPTGEYRLTNLADVETVLGRLRSTIRVPDASPGSHRVTLSLKDLGATKKAARAGNAGKALKTLEENGLSGAGAQLLVAALAAPAVRGSIALFKNTARTVVEGRNLAFVGDAASSWIATSPDEDAKRMTLETVDAASFTAALTRYLTELDG